MGWNTWNTFRCNLNETLLQETADAMVASGMRDVGYSYVVIDDCWQGGRDANGELFPDPKKFPAGIPALAEYMHEGGLELGVYSDADPATCQGLPASRGHEFQDARTFAKWGVDFLKFDWCNTDRIDPREAYPLMRDALIASGRGIVFSMSEWGVDQPWAHGVGHMWRVTEDIRSCWDCQGEHVQSVPSIMDQYAANKMFKASAPGGWNDLDMLEVGVAGLNTVEAQSHFNLWAIAAAPLIAGNDLRNMDADTQRILTNAEVIAVNQDPLGRGGFLYRRFPNGGDIWQKSLAPAEDGSVRNAFVMFNRGDQGITIPLYVTGDGKLRDLWAGQNVPIRDGAFAPEVVPHASVMVIRTGGDVPK